MKIERVFDLTGPDGKYQNIRIALEGDVAKDLIEELYTTLYMERLFYAYLSHKEATIFETMLEEVKKAREMLDTMDTLESEDVPEIEDVAEATVENNSEMDAEET